MFDPTRARVASLEGEDGVAGVLGLDGGRADGGGEEADDAEVQVRHPDVIVGQVLRGGLGGWQSDACRAAGTNRAVRAHTQHMRTSKLPWTV